ncbi:MAG: type III-B CRISPR module RAMP protein Cmr1, partial [Meiothermus silvanus]|nr:type III-B CRISPR module RAMP protein Cmr1 [Allomeiothermus silvanus]
MPKTAWTAVAWWRWGAGRGSWRSWRCEVRRVAEFKDAYRPVLRNDDVVETRKYELLTPLIGAGSSPFINDLQMPIRGGSIRGVLRFWWRATCGNRFG